MSSEHDSGSNNGGRSGSDRRHPRTLDALCEASDSTRVSASNRNTLQEMPSSTQARLMKTRTCICLMCPEWQH